MIVSTSRRYDTANGVEVLSYTLPKGFESSLCANHSRLPYSINVGGSFFAYKRVISRFGYILGLSCPVCVIRVELYQYVKVSNALLQ
jgi:hypothetical protein